MLSQPDISFGGLPRVRLREEGQTEGRQATTAFKKSSHHIYSRKVICTLRVQLPYILWFIAVDVAIYYHATIGCTSPLSSRLWTIDSSYIISVN
jgi:hypothetical protein